MVSSRRQPGEERRRAYRAGMRAELAAALYLTLKGYRILARRFRTQAGEIDLIARRRRRLAFIEVKQRAQAEDALAAVSPHQQQRVRRAAGVWLARHPRHRADEIGFDVVVLTPWRLPAHVVDAFTHMPY